MQSLPRHIESAPSDAPVAVLVALLSCAVVAGVLVRSEARSVGSPWVFAAIALLVIVSASRPMLIHLGEAEDPQRHDLLEGVLVVAMLTLPALGILFAFFASSLVVARIRHRPRPLAAADIARTMFSVGLGLVVFAALAGNRAVTVVTVGDAIVATAVTSLASAGTRALVIHNRHVRRTAAPLGERFALGLALIFVGVLVGVIGAIAVIARSWAVLPVVALFALEQYGLDRQFRASREKTRMQGLLAATLEINEVVDEERVAVLLIDAVSSLLHCRTTISETASFDGGLKVDPTAFDRGLKVEMCAAGVSRWLVAHERDNGEPFAGVDGEILDSLAAVGAAAFGNAARYEEQLREQENLVAITSSLGEGVCAFTTAGFVRFVNPAAEELLGWSAEELYEKRDGSAESDLAFLLSPAVRAMRFGATIRSERASFYRRNGEVVPVEYTCSPIKSGEETSGAVITFRDVSERVKFEEKLEFHAFHDALTGLVNRRAFVEGLQHALGRSARTGAMHAVLFCDVDRFKLANDSLGHQAGDQLLISVASRLRALTRTSDTLSRFGGDEFTVLVEDIDGPKDAEDIASRIVDSIREPIVLEGGQTVMLGVSVGIALGGAESSPDDILHDADVAMYEAKRSGTNRYVFFDAVAMGPRSSKKVELEVELERALENHELVTYYQPIIAADTLDIVGAEALVRWNHPERGLLLPGEFIDLAEETGMITRLGGQVLEQACTQAAAWREATGVALQISVNLSARQFVALDLVDHISAVLKRTRLSPSQLCIEITESLTLQDTEHAIDALLDLKAIGLQLALDDFGTGYSSLNYLRRIPVDIVKLDRSFVHDLTVSPVGNAIVGSIIDLARTIGLSVIAEGVETEEEFHRLAEMGCPAIQGHYFAEPMTAEELTSRLSTRFEASKNHVLRLGARRAPVVALHAV